EFTSRRYAHLGQICVEPMDDRNCSTLAKSWRHPPPIRLVAYLQFAASVARVEIAIFDVTPSNPCPTLSKIRTRAVRYTQERKGTTCLVFHTVAHDGAQLNLFLTLRGHHCPR